ncbi:hypothetical protein LSAT2_024872 [Lamellibrachia satsuma]|nr:hypothetical protein LSAT2_024872 [Lamellibrachia satsuma]
MKALKRSHEGENRETKRMADPEPRHAPKAGKGRRPASRIRSRPPKGHRAPTGTSTDHLPSESTNFPANSRYMNMPPSHQSQYTQHVAAPRNNGWKKAEVWERAEAPLSVYRPQQPYTHCAFPMSLSVNNLDQALQLPRGYRGK